MTNEDFSDLGDVLRRITAHLSYLTSAYGFDLGGGARDQRGDPCGDPPISQKDQA